MGDPPITGACVGVHLGAEAATAAYVCDGRLHRLARAPMADGRWLLRGAGTLDYFSRRDLVGVRLPNGEEPTAAIDAVQDAIASARSDGHDVSAVAVVVPATFEDFQRHNLLARLHEGGGPPVRLVDSGTAGALGSHTEGDGRTSRVAVCVSDETALELAIARVDAGRCEVLAREIEPALGARTLGHHLLQRLVDHLPANRAAELADLASDELLAVIARLVQGVSRIARAPESRFPLRLGGDVTVRFHGADVEEFFEARLPLLDAAVARLREAARMEGPLDRVVLIGEFAELSDFTDRLERLLGPAEIGSASVLADGAALVAREPFVPADVEALRPLQAIEAVARHHGAPLSLPVVASKPRALDELVDEVFVRIERLASEGSPDAARVIARLSERLDECRQRASDVISAPGAVAGQPVPRAARRMAEAERLLEVGKVLEAVAAAHLAYEAAPRDHAALLAMLDVHRRAAAKLEGPENFEAAILQLQCALQHRRQDEETQRALAQRYEEQALHLERHGRIGAARELLERALELVVDDTRIVAHLDRLEMAG